MSENIILLFVLYLGLCTADTHKAVIDVVPASPGSTASLQCYTHGVKSCFPWPHYPERQKNCTAVWMKDGKVLEPHGRINVTSSVTYNFCDTFTITPQQYSSASGLELPKTGVIDDYNTYSGFGCFVSTLTIVNVEASDFGVYQCNYSDHRSDLRYQWHYLANVTLVETEDYVSKPKVDLVFQSDIPVPDTDEKEKLAQCISVGTSLDWYYTERSKDMIGCGSTDYYDCVFRKHSVSISNLATADIWRCFEITNLTREALTREALGYEVFQSFLSFKSVCDVDNFYFFCGSADKSIADTKGKFIVGPPYHKYYWHVRGELHWAAVFVGVLVSAMIFGASVLSCSRITCVRFS